MTPLELSAMGQFDLGEMLTTALGEAWSKFVYYISFQFVDPFWWWLIAAIVYISALTVALALWRFYFGALPNWLQKLLGLSVIAAIWGLFVYRKGERDARAHDAAKPRHKPEREPEREPPPRQPIDDQGAHWNPFGKW